jgi:Holliday junction DNA helicase RuvA
LRDKAGAMPAGVGFSPVVPQPTGGVEADALSALVNLGYRRQEAYLAVGRVIERLGDDTALAALIRESLKELGR